MSPPSLTPYADSGLLNLGDFIKYESILHPLAIGSIAIVYLFGCLRFSSNRTVAPLTIWDGICSVALGSTLASIVNGQQLVRGLMALSLLLMWQYLTSWTGCKFPKVGQSLADPAKVKLSQKCGVLFTKPPLIVAFRGHLLEGLMRKHRLNKVDVYGALRKSGILNICEVECMVVAFSIFKIKDMPEDYDPEILLAVKGYRELVKEDEEQKRRQKEEGMGRSQSTLAESEEGGCQREKRLQQDEEGQTREDQIAHDAA